MHKNQDDDAFCSLAMSSALRGATGCMRAHLMHYFGCAPRGCLLIGFLHADASLLAARVEQARSEAIQKLVDSGHVMTKIQDSSLARNSSAMRYMTQQESVVRLARQAAGSVSA